VAPARWTETSIPLREFRTINNAVIFAAWTWSILTNWKTKEEVSDAQTGILEGPGALEKEKAPVFLCQEQPAPIPKHKLRQFFSLAVLLSVQVFPESGG
jgi:hypothetical protein